MLTYNYALNAYKYIYRNPIEAGLCINVEDYEFSTLRGLLGLNKLAVPVEEDLTLFSDMEGTLKWINRAYPNLEIKETIANAMKKNRFKFPEHFNQDEVF